MGYKVKKRYVGTQQVRPGGISKSIDLRGKTLAQIRTEGFDIAYRNGSYILDSNGLRTTQSDENNGVQLYYRLPAALTTSNKIYLKQTGYGNSPGELGGINEIGLHIGAGDSSSGQEFYNCIRGQYGNGSYYSSTPDVVKSGVFYKTSLINSGNGGTRGNVTIEMNIDLSTGSYSLKCSSPLSYTLTGTLTSSQINTILTYQYITFSVVTLPLSGDCRIYTAEFKVK